MRIINEIKRTNSSAVNRRQKQSFIPAAFASGLEAAGDDSLNHDGGSDMINNRKELKNQMIIPITSKGKVLTKPGIG
jgi:hypothetical protein